MNNKENKIKQSKKDLRAVENQQKLEGYYDFVDSNLNNPTELWQPSYQIDALTAIVKYGRDNKDEKYNKNVELLLAEIAGNLSLTHLLYTSHTKPQYLFDLSNYGSKLNSSFTPNFENALNSYPSDSGRIYYYIEEIALYTRILQHHNQMNFFSEDVLKHFINYINHSKKLSHLTAWFSITENNIPKLDEQILEEIKPKTLVQLMNDLELFNAYNQHIHPLYESFGNKFDVSERIGCALPKNFKLGITL